MRMHRCGRRVILGGIAGLGLLSAGAGLSGVQAQSAPVAAAGAWARATPPHAPTAAVYLTLTSAAADRLLTASTPVAAGAELHRTLMEGGVMKMRPLTGGLALPAGKPVTLAPGGMHIMLTGLKAPLQAGQSIALHLVFASAPPLDVAVEVRPIGGGAPAMPGMSHTMKMD